VSCKTHPVYEHFYLHRFRKTCATRWQEHARNPTAYCSSMVGTQEP
jgi:hypothetical protein